jgi:hypothetical protein
MIKKLLLLFVVFGSVACGAEVVEEVVNPWMPIIGRVLDLAIDILSPILIMLASFAAWKLAGKFGIEKNIVADNALREYVLEGINWADQWAKEQIEKPTSDQKFNVAVEYILKLIKKSSLPKTTEDRLKAMIEAKLKEL